MECLSALYENPPREALKSTEASWDSRHASVCAWSKASTAFLWTERNQTLSNASSSSAYFPILAHTSHHVTPHASQINVWQFNNPAFLTHRVHECRFRVGHQHKHIRIQTELVDPAVQLCGDVSSRAEITVKYTHFTLHTTLQRDISTAFCAPGSVPVHQNQVVSEQGTLRLGPEHFHETASIQTLIHV